MTPRIERHKNLGPMHDLLLKATVPDRTGKKSITVLAASLDMTTQGVFKWIKNQNLPARPAAKIVALHTAYADRVGLPAEDRVSLRQFDQYVYI